MNFAGTVGETQTITIGINNDAIVEGDETFTVLLSGVDTSTGTGTPFADNADIDASDTGTGTIINTDTADLTVGDATVDEEAGTITFAVTLDNPVEGGFSVDYGTLDVTTESGDFTCLLYTSPSPRDATLSRMPSSA